MDCMCTCDACEYEYVIMQCACALSKFFIPPRRSKDITTSTHTHQKHYYCSIQRTCKSQPKTPAQPAHRRRWWINKERHDQNEHNINSKCSVLNFSIRSHAFIHSFGFQVDGCYYVLFCLLFYAGVCPVLWMWLKIDLRTPESRCGNVGDVKCTGQTKFADVVGAPMVPNTHRNTKIRKIIIHTRWKVCRRSR